MLSMVTRYVDDVAGADNTRLYPELRLFQAHRSQWTEVLEIYPSCDNVKP